MLKSFFIMAIFVYPSTLYVPQRRTSDPHRTKWTDFNSNGDHENIPTTQDDDDATDKDIPEEPRIPLHIQDGLEFNDKKNIDCEDFAGYALHCTAEAVATYNSTRKAPPKPTMLYQWCKAIRLMTNCAIDWNTDCKEFTDNHFSLESVNGHQHVLTNICEDTAFEARYEEAFSCIENTVTEWEDCYIDFKAHIDEQKNSTRPWTHYDTHFTLCCARAKFRACTLDVLFHKPGCTADEAVVLQKFSVIVSEGDVFQECDHNVMYENCPGGDPRPSAELLTKLVARAKDEEELNTASIVKNGYLCAVLSVVHLFMM